MDNMVDEFVIKKGMIDEMISFVKSRELDERYKYDIAVFERDKLQLKLQQILDNEEVNRETSIKTFSEFWFKDCEARSIKDKVEMLKGIIDDLYEWRDKVDGG